MTDIYDFRNPIFIAYKKEWKCIYRMISKHCAIIDDVIELSRYYNFFNKHKITLWDNCPDETIWMFISRARQIVHHEQIYLPHINSLREIKL